jgi:hypothetical protein
MNQCKQCGATLPEGTRFCLQCGAEVSAEETRPSPSMPPRAQKELDFLQPALTGGFALGVISAIPIVGGLNCLCCLWVQAGGGLATWLLNKQRPGTLKYGDGALVGVLSGLIGGVVSTLIGIPIQMLVMTQETFSQTMSQMPPNLPPWIRDMMTQMMEPGFSLSRTLISLCINVLLFSTFALIGGIITTAILNRKKTE